MSKRDYVKQTFYDSTGIIQNEDIEVEFREEEIDIIADLLSGKKVNDEPYDPKIDKIFELHVLELKELMKEKNTPLIIKKRWPFGKKFAVAITHDADRISVDKEHFNKVKDRFTEETIKDFLSGKKDPYWNIENMAEIEKEFGFKSSFYLLLSDYRIDEKLQVLKKLKEEGWEIGLHGGFDTHNNKNELLKQLKLFNDYFGNKPDGIRQHYLKFDPENTWEIMNGLDLKYDTTWGYNESPGFKAGISTPFHPPSSDWICFNILEIPLILMDTSLWGYMNLEEEQGLELIKDIINTVQKTGGLFTILWHQEALLMKKGRIYRRILEMLSKQECFVGSGFLINKWWTGRNNVIVNTKKQGNEWIYSIKNPPESLVIEVHYKNSENIKIKGNGTINKKTNTIVEIEVMENCEIIVRE
ncbi:MAG: polysaccharide deacetylase family protein [Thermoproteota archaeon]